MLDVPRRQTLPADQSLRHSDDGQVLIIFALATFVLIGFVALSVDAGFLMAERRQAQSAADAGALAAATDVLRNKTNAIVQTSGQAYGALNADVPAGNVTVNWPASALAGTYAGNIKYVEVIVTKPVDKFFVGAVYTGAWEVSARAVAGIEPKPRPYALLALNAPGIYINGTTSVYVDGGSAMSNSNINSSGGSNIFSAGGSIDAAGTISGNASWQASDGINASMPVIPDPLAATPAPPKEMTRTAPNCSNNCEFEPGYYNNLGTITISKTATFQTGIYYFDGNTTLNLQNTNSTIIGNGVLFYFTGSSRFTPGNGNITLRAPSTSPYTNGLTGMALWIARPNCSTFDSQGNGTFSVEGVIYAPCSHVELHGTPQSLGIQVIVGDLVIKGTSDMHLVYREYVLMDKPKVWLVQ
ncbi:MAG: pilus assembly protein TadG-related protein [Chloroflexota bacterium]|nr:pilus assembly protein TadG-related protein [Chloroflexota bacterium]